MLNDIIALDICCLGFHSNFLVSISELTNNLKGSYNVPVGTEKIGLRILFRYENSQDEKESKTCEKGERSALTQQMPE